MLDKISWIGFLLVLFASTLKCQDEETPPLIIDPFRLTVEVGTDAIFNCHLTATKPSHLTKISWFYPDNVTKIGPQSNESHIFVDEESQLNVISAQENDTGLYLCMVVLDYSNGTISKKNPLIALELSNYTSSNASMLPNSVNQSDTNAVTDPSITGTSPADEAEEHVEVYNTTVYLKVYIMPTYFTEGMIILAINLGLLLIFIICLIQSLVTEKKRKQLYQNKY